MDRQELVSDVIDYFRSSDHWRRLVALLQEPDPRNAHVHSYVNTSIHPESLEEILVRYFALRGWPLVRKINKLRPRPGVMDLHGIEPEGKVHFEFLCLYEEDVGVRAADGGEGGSNLLFWNRSYLEDFYRGFPFRSVGPKEKEALRRYFISDHWEKGLEIAIKPNVPHMHINVETSVHPTVIGQYALEALRERGWEADYICPNAFMLHGNYIGKLVFMGRKPEKVYDIGWQFTPDVVIKPTEASWMYPERTGYDVMTSEEFDEEVNQHPYVRLAPDEIGAVLEACKGMVP